MELANLKYIRLNGRSFWRKTAVRVPSYEAAKKLDAVIVDDLLRLNPAPANIALLNKYVSDGFLLVPIRRRLENRRPTGQGFPSRVLLELTSKCNLKCTMCPRNALTRPQKHMPKDTAMCCMDEIDAVGVEGLWLYNIGESLLHPDFKEIFSYCQTKKNLGSLWMSTNGQELSDEAIRLVIDSNLTFLNYSLNAMSAKAYKLVSPTGDYQRLVVNLDRLFAYKVKQGKLGSPPWVRVQMVDQPHISGEIDAFLAAYAAKAELLSVNLLEAFSQNVPQNLVYAKGRRRREKKYCNRIQRGDGFIFADGEVSFCDTDFNHEMSIGNVSNSSLSEIWSGSERQRYKKLNEAGDLDEIGMCRWCLDYDL